MAWFKPKLQRDAHAETMHVAAFRVDFNDAEFQLDLYGVELPDNRAVRRLRCHCPPLFASRFAEVLERQIGAYEKKFGAVRLARTPLDIDAQGPPAERELSLNTVLVSFTESELILTLRCLLIRPGETPQLLDEIHAFAAVTRAPAMLAVLRSALDEHRKRYASFP
jgi:hypothetical protein